MNQLKIKESEFGDCKFKFLNLLQKRGKQGLVGLCELQSKECKSEGDERQDEKQIGSEREYIFKLSQYLDFTIRHEYLIMKGLNNLREYCPHFSYCLGIFTDKVSPEFRKAANPFNYGKSYAVNTDILVTEYIKDGRKFCSFIKNKRISEDIILSIVKQVLLAIMIAQKKQNFTHYDLHSNNILIRKCDPNTVFKYIIDGKTYVVPTYGYYPVIIDFGFSHSSSLEQHPIYCALAHTDIGFISTYFDKVTDSKLFLITVSDEFKKYRKSKVAKSFRKVVRRLFSPLDIDFSSGWDENQELSVSDSITRMLRKSKNTSDLFFDYNHYCADIVQALVTVPIKNNKSYDKLTMIETYNMFVHEFEKIENEIGSSFYNLYIFREIVDVVIQVKDEYINKETRENAIRLFRHSIYDIIGSVSKYSRLNTINYEKLLCGLIAFSSQLESVLYHMVNNKIKEKEKEYSKLEISSIEEIYNLIDKQFETPLKDNSSFHVWNTDEEKNYIEANC